jgi:hypothetical protein
MKKEIFVRITGGLGNQLFGLAAAVEQALRLNCRAVLLVDNYGTGNPRRFVLDQLVLPEFVEIDSGRQQSDSLRNQVVFQESGFGYDPSIMAISKGTILEGYFQSPKYFTNSLDILDEAIFPTTGMNTAYAMADQYLSHPYIALHVRRGDYLVPGTLEFHGIATSTYFQHALDLIEALHGQKRIIVFTDSPEHVQEELSIIRQDWELFDSELIPGDFQTLRAMSFADSIVMSNSSFGWWAAWKMQSRLGAGLYPKVVAPRPWFTNGESASDLLHHTWITIGC